MSFILMLLLSLARSCVRLHLASMVTQQLQYSRCHSSGNHSFRRARTRVVVSQTQVLALHVAHLRCSTSAAAYLHVSLVVEDEQHCRMGKSSNCVESNKIMLLITIKLVIFHPPVSTISNRRDQRSERPSVQRERERERADRGAANPR